MGRTEKHADVASRTTTSTVSNMHDMIFEGGRLFRMRRRLKKKREDTHNDRNELTQWVHEQNMNVCNDIKCAGGRLSRIEFNNTTYCNETHTYLI